MKKLTEIINAAVNHEIDRLLQPFTKPASVLDCYFCVLEDLQRPFLGIDRWQLRILLAIQILERHLTEGEEELTMRRIYDHATKEQRAQSWAHMEYVRGEIENIINC